MEQLFIVNLILVWLALLGQFLLTFALIRKVNSINEVTDESGKSTIKFRKDFLKVGHLAPDFVAATVTGSLVTVADYAQCKVAFIFLSPGCRPCRKAIPTLETLGPLAEKNGTSLTLVIASDQEEAKEFIREFSISLPTVITPPEGKFMQDYKVGGTPFYCVINEQKRIEATGFFDNTWQELTDKWMSVPAQNDLPIHS